MKQLAVLASVGRTHSWLLFRDLGIPLIFAAFSISVAYQVRLPLRMDMRNDNSGYATGFYYVQQDGEHYFRWTGGNGLVVFPDVGKATPLLLTIKANAWRNETLVYTATVTVNGAEVGAITRAGWRTWQFTVSDPAILSAEALVVGIHSRPFLPGELYNNPGETRALGLGVESVEIHSPWRLPAGTDRWTDFLTIPSWKQLVFVSLLGIGVYLLYAAVGFTKRSAQVIALGAILFESILVAFSRTSASQFVLLVAIAVGVAACIKSLSDTRLRRSQERAPFWLANWTVWGAVILLAFALRWHSLTWLVAEPDEQFYIRVAENYAGFLSTGNWASVIGYDGGTGHPALYELVFAIGLVVRDWTHIPASNLDVARFIATILGALQVGVLAIVNPIAGWISAVQTTEIKFTSTAYLEALPALAAAVSVLAFEQFRRTRSRSWLYGSAIALGVAGASKFIYLTAGIAIFAFLLWEQRRHPKIILGYCLLAGLAFLVLDPYLWFDPVGRVIGMFQFHASNSQTEWVVRHQLPWYQTMVTLAKTVTVLPVEQLHERPPVFFVEWDTLIYGIGLAGLPSLWRRSPLYVAWLLIDAVFLVFWQAKWDQYAMILAFPLFLAAGFGMTDWLAWIGLTLQTRFSWRRSGVGV